MITTGWTLNLLTLTAGVLSLVWPLICGVVTSASIDYLKKTIETVAAVSVQKFFLV
jgi:hypothetical protein